MPETVSQANLDNSQQSTEERALAASTAYRALQERLVLKSTKPSPNPFPPLLADDPTVRRDAAVHETQIEFEEHDDDLPPTVH